MHGNDSGRRLVPVLVLVGAMAVLLVAPGRVDAVHVDLQHSRG